MLDGHRLLVTGVGTPDWLAYATARRALLSEVAAAVGRDWRPGTVAFEDVRQARLDALGDLVADHLDTGAVRALLAGGAPAGLPFVPPGAP